jgi:hypothetical protein
MKKIILILMILILASFSFASVMTVVEVTINSVKAPSLCTFKYQDYADVEARINTTAYLQVGTFNNPVAISRSNIRVRQGETGYISYLNEITTGNVFLTFDNYETNSAAYNQNCVRQPTYDESGDYIERYTLNIGCVTPSGSSYAPCGGSGSSNHIPVENNCKMIKSNTLEDAYCMSLN